MNVLEIDAFEERREGAVSAVALESVIAKARMIPGDAPLLHKLALRIVREYGRVGQDIVVSRHLPLDIADYLRLQGERLVIQEPFLPQRANKSAVQVDAIAGATARCTKAFVHIENMLRESVIDGDVLKYRGDVLTSELLHQETLLNFCANGLENTDGPTIACGAHAAMPHHHGTGPVRPHQTIVCDLYPRDRESGYYADMTRTYVKGEPSDTMRRMYDAVAKAQDAAFSAVRPGVPAKDVHEAAAEAIRDAGFDAGQKGFTHSIGHGLGLDLHELPGVGPDRKRAGNRHAILSNRGCIYPEHGGVRIEDTVVVTERGYRNLTNYPREFIITI